ncbi:hypothetical protein AC1031_016751 [Aphanomyces cochlioides]|nr:hypothetical protein AC1031_016751 [Aphanomyces cochlioides]
MKPSAKSNKFEKTKQSLRDIMLGAEHAESSLRRLKEGVRRAMNDLESQKEMNNLADIEAFVDACAQNNSRPARAAWLKHQFEGYKLDLAEQAEALAAGDTISIDGSSSESDSSQDSSDDYDPRGKEPRLDERSKYSTLKGVKGKGKLISHSIVRTKTRVITVAEVPHEANHVKSRLESAKRSFVDLLLALERVAGPEVFHFLLFNIHPFWPDLGMPACMLKQLKSAEAVGYIESQGRKRWPDFAQFPNLLYKKDLLAITMDPSLPPRAQLQWSWSLLKWMREKAKIKKQEVEEMVKRVEAGVHLERTGPFPFVNYPDGVFEMPEWMRAQQSTDANFVGKWVGLPGRPVVMDQTDGSFLVGSDVSGLGSADGPTTL